MLYSFKYFNHIHIQAIVVWIILSIIIISVPFFKKGIEKIWYTKLIGYFLIFVKIFDLLYRVYVEKEAWKYVIPLNLCNVSIIIAGIYFITKKNIFFNFLYFFFPGAILAILLPNITFHYTLFYVHVFIGTHMLEIMAVIYSFVHLEARVTKKGLIYSIIFYLVLVFIARVVNALLGTNYMFVNNYIISAIDFIKPLNLYVILLISLFIISMILTYLPFRHIDNEEVQEYNI